MMTRSDDYVEYCRRARGVYRHGAVCGIRTRALLAAWPSANPEQLFAAKTRAVRAPAWI